MMKTKSLLAALLVACLNLITLASAEGIGPVPPGVGIAGIPVWSPDVLRIFAEGQVRAGTLKVWCRSLDSSYPGVTEVTVQGDGLDDVVQRLQEQTFDFRVLNPSDEVHWGVELKDGMGLVLFYGNTWTLASSGGKPFVSLLLADVPVLEGVERAEALVLSKDGSTWERWPLWVREDGKLMFPGWMAGTPNVMVAVTFKDGQIVVYRTGQPDSGEERFGQTGSAGVGVANRYEFTDPPAVEMAVTDRPSFRFTINKPLVTVFNVPGVTYWKGGITTVEWPKAIFIVRRITSYGVEGESIPLNTTGLTEVFLPVGTYSAFLVWDAFGAKPPIPTGYGEGPTPVPVPVGEKGF